MPAMRPARSGKSPQPSSSSAARCWPADLWEERRLAYPIKGHRKGTYWLTYFRLDGKQVDELTRRFHLNEGILRSLLLKIDPRIADAMVQHALTGGGPIGGAQAQA